MVSLSHDVRCRTIRPDRTREYLLQFTTFAAISVSCPMVNICIIWLAVELVSRNYMSAKVIAAVSRVLLELLRAEPDHVPEMLTGATDVPASLSQV